MDYRLMVYQPREDTIMLKRFLESKDLTDKKALEIGTGSAILAKTMKEQGAKVTATDKDEKVIEKAKNKIETTNIRFIVSDLFDKINKKYDIIIFNPPYLPAIEDQEQTQKTWYGGEKGTEITRKFLNQVSTYLTDDGQFYIIGSNMSDIDNVIEEYNLEIVRTEKLFFEEIYILSGT